MQLEAALLTAALWPVASAIRCQARADLTSLPDALNKAVRSILTVCGWVTLAAVADGFLRRWVLALLPEGIAVVLTGLMELTNGILAAGNLGKDARFLLCALFASFGGISVLLQIRGVSPGIRMGQCIGQKTAHAVITTALAFLYLRTGIPALFLSPALLFAKIAVEIPSGMMYNVRRKEGI